MDKNQQVEVLLAALEERYKAIHIIRERVQSVGLWLLGLLVGASAWIIQNDSRFLISESFYYLIALVLSVGAVRLYFLSDLEKGFKNQQKVAAKIEDTLGFYKTALFNDKDESIYPNSWQKAGQTEGAGGFFKTTYLLIYVGSFILVVSILLNTCIPHKHQRQIPSQEIYIIR